MSGKAPFYQLARHGWARIFLAIHNNETASPDDHPELPRLDPLWGLLQSCWDAKPTQRPVIDNVNNEVRLLRKTTSTGVLTQVLPSAATGDQKSHELNSTIMADCKGLVHRGVRAKQCNLSIYGPKSGSEEGADAVWVESADNSLKGSRRLVESTFTRSGGTVFEKITICE